MTDTQLAQVAHISSLRALALPSCEAVTDTGLAELWRLQGLTLLDLQNCCKVGHHLLGGRRSVGVLGGGGGRNLIREEATMAVPRKVSQMKVVS